MGRKIEFRRVGHDRIPGEITARGFIDILNTNTVDRQEDERILKEPRCGSTRLENCACRLLSGVSSFFGVRLAKAQDDEPRIEVVSDILARRRHGVYSLE